MQWLDTVEPMSKACCWKCPYWVAVVMWSVPYESEVGPKFVAAYEGWWDRLKGNYVATSPWLRIQYDGHSIYKQCRKSDSIIMLLSMRKYCAKNIVWVLSLYNYQSGGASLTSTKLSYATILIHITMSLIWRNELLIVLLIWNVFQNERFT